MKSFAKISLDDSNTWLWERGLASLPGACQVKRMVCFGNSLSAIKDTGDLMNSICWDRNPRAFNRKLPLMDPEVGGGGGCR